MNDETVDTTSEQYRHECEVRYVLSIPDRDDRKRYLAGIRQRRGNDAVERIKNDMKRIAREGRQNASV